MGTHELIQYQSANLRINEALELSRVETEALKSLTSAHQNHPSKSHATPGPQIEKSKNVPYMSRWGCGRNKEVVSSPSEIEG